MERILNPGFNHGSLELKDDLVGGLMPTVKVRVLGRVDIIRDGELEKLRPKETATLAVLIASRERWVRKDELDAWIWPEAPDSDGVPRVIWQLRKALKGSGLDIPDARRGPGLYQLVTEPGASWADAVDGYHFEALVQAADDLLSDGAEAAALGYLRDAASTWQGEPFDIDWRIPLPDPCDRYRARLGQDRDRLIRRVAEIALRHGEDYSAAGIYRGRPAGQDARRLDAAWLVDVLTRMRDRLEADVQEDIEVREAEAFKAAARNAAAGRPRGISDATRRARDLVMLQGASVQVHRPLAAQPRQQVAGSPEQMVGRAAELEAFERMLGTVRAGRPALMTVRGASGSGKTRLTEEFAARAASTGMPMLVAVRGQPGDLQPWWYLAGTLWANCCRDIAAGRDPLTQAQRRALDEFITGHAAPPGHHLAYPDEAYRQQIAELALAVGALIGQTALRRQGMIVAFDDAERLSERGYQLLRQVLAGLGGAPVGWVLIGQDTETWTAVPEPGPAEVRSELMLRPLGPAAVRRWLAQVWGREPSDAETGSILQSTQGMPVGLCDELSRMAAPAAVPSPSAAAEQADPRHWVAAAAITATGLDIDTGLVARMLELTDAEADRQQAAARVPWRIDTAARIRFKHARWLTAALQILDVDPALRRFLHHRAVLVLSERLRTADSPDQALPVRIAEHARGADRSLLPRDAARAYLAAARAEKARLSIEAAESWARYGLERPSDPAIRFGLHMVLGDALDARGAPNEAEDQYRLAYDAARGRPRQQAEAAIAMARRWSDPGRIDNDLLRILRASLDGLAGDRDRAGIELSLQLKAYLAHKLSLAIPVQENSAGGAPLEGVSLARQCLDQLPADLPPLVRCEILTECRWAVFDYDPPAKTIKISQALHEASTDARSPGFAGEALVALVTDQLRLGQITQAVGTAAEHERSMLPSSHRAAWMQLTMDILMDLWRGRFDQAEQRLFGEARLAVERARADRSRSADTLQQTWQGQVYWLMRERGQMRQLVDSEVAEQIERHLYFPIWRAAIILAYCDAGRLDEAADQLAAMAHATDDFGTFPPHGWTPPVAALLADACLALSPPGASPHRLAGPLRDILDRYPGEFVLAGWPTVLLGPVARFSGVLATAMGDYDEAIDLFDRAIPRVSDARPQVIRLRLDKARALVYRGSADETTAILLNRVREEAGQLGMTPVEAEAERLLVLAQR